MEIYISRQLVGTLYSALAGVIMAALYDLLRGVRALLGIAPASRLPEHLRELPGFPHSARSAHAAILLNLLDLLYFAFISAAYCVFLFYVSYSRVRWYLLAGSLFGALVYRRTLSRLLMPLLDSAAVLIRFGAVMLLRAISLPTVSAFRLVKALLSSLCFRTVEPIKRKRIRRARYKLTEQTIEHLGDFISGKPVK